MPAVKEKRQQYGFEDDHWDPTGTVHYHYGKGYGIKVTPSGEVKTILVKPPETLPKAPQPLPQGQDVVSKPPPNGNLPLPPKQLEVLKQKNRGGRPRKKDKDIESRVTHWRRRKEKELQGVLI